MKFIYRLLVFGAMVIVFSSEARAQQEPIWDIGTKWVYEFSVDGTLRSALTNEITDTITIDGLKLYVVESEPEFTGIQYFHYKDGDVYNYNPTTGILQLLYDFESTVGYKTDYIPICDPFFEEAGYNFKSYQIEIDSVDTFEMPDGTMRNLQHATPIDTFFDGTDTSYIRESHRRILENVGFLNGYIHHTHDWEIGVYICDEFANYVFDLRCFANDSVSYNFVDYPCDSTYVITSTREPRVHTDFFLYPNPTQGIVHISDLSTDAYYEIYSLNGNLIETGVTDSGNLQLQEAGVNIIRIKIEDTWRYHRVMKLE